MQRLSLIIAVATIAVCLPITIALAAKSHTARATIKATSTGAPIAGPCNEGYSTLCPSGICSCFKYQGSVTGNLAGNGAAVLDITVDTGTGYATSSPGCAPAYASIVLTARDTQTLNVISAVCTANKTGAQPIAGGFGIADSLKQTVGSGTLTGNIDGTGNISLKLVGLVTP